MTTQSIMTPDPVTVRVDSTVAGAVRLMHAHRVHDLPVVDQEGCFAGMFGVRRLIRALLPVAAQLDHFGLTDLSYLPDDLPEVVERLSELGGQPVSHFLDKDKQVVCSCDTPLVELMHLLTTAESSLPVVVIRGERRKVVGMVSNWDVLTKIGARVFGQGEATPPEK